MILLMWTQIDFPKLKFKVIFVFHEFIGSILLEVKALKTCQGFPISIVVKSYRKFCK